MRTVRRTGRLNAAKIGTHEVSYPKQPLLRAQVSY